MDTLVLDLRYTPVARVSWTRAVTLLWLGKAEVIEEYEDWTVRSVTLEIKVPSVIRFLRAILRGKRIVRFSRENVYARDSGRCQYCGRAVSRAEATFDHVIPRARGGRTQWENVVISCLPCNQRKGGRTPLEAGLRIRTMPVKPKKLPDTLRLTFRFEGGMPASWRGWLRDFSYWNGELVRDDRVEHEDT
jgi:5-methylcytosine-specific restriction endonuclease McrA